MSQKPSISRDVHYTDSAYGGPFAAKVTAVHPDGTVDLIIFPPHEVVLVGGPSGFYTATHVKSGPYDGTEPKAGCWHWPPRV